MIRQKQLHHLPVHFFVLHKIRYFMFILYMLLIINSKVSMYYVMQFKKKMIKKKKKDYKFNVKNCNFSEEKFIRNVYLFL